jgi:hypothetical protein
MASGDCNPGPAATPSLPCVAEREAAGWAANKRKNQSPPIARCQARNSGPLNKSASFASSARDGVLRRLLFVTHATQY